MSIPFPGSKRYAYKAVKAIAQGHGYDTVLEPFGGSCVLSVNLMADGLVKRAVAGDYDLFFADYGDYLDVRDKLTDLCFKSGLKRTYHCDSGGKRRENLAVDSDGNVTAIDRRVLSMEDRETLQKLVLQTVPQRLWRHFYMGSKFVHSSLSIKGEGDYSIGDFRYFDGYLKSDREREYLKALGNVELECLDYRDFIEKHRGEITPKTLLILDPPYVGASQYQYQGEFTERDTVEMLDLANGLGCDYIFFNHDRDKVTRWLDGLECDIGFVGNARSSVNRRRRDVMAFVRVAQ